MRVGQNWEQQLTRSLGSLAPGQGTCIIGRCKADGDRNGRSAANPIGGSEEEEEEPKGRCLLLLYFVGRTEVRITEEREQHSEEAT